MSRPPTRGRVVLPEAEPRLNSRTVVALTGLSYVFVGLGFSYLDRRYGYFALEGTLWLVWALLGFGAGTLNALRPPGAGRSLWLVMGGVGGVLALFPGFLMFNLLRWTGLTLMIVMGARAVLLRTRRDFYLTLMVIFVVSFLVGTHGNADWTLWFYLGPAWVLGGLALAWEHAAGVRLSRWVKGGMTLVFMVVALLLVIGLFFFAPRPTVLSFGFLPPGTDTPGRFTQPAGPGDGLSNLGQGGSGGQGPGQGGVSGGALGETGSPWDALLQDMRRALSDGFIPDWQRGLMQKLLDAAQSLREGLNGSFTMQLEWVPLFSINLWQMLAWLLAALLISWLLWRWRWRVGLVLTLGCAWLLAHLYPLASMWLSARALRWCLQAHGHPRQPGQSVREHWLTAPGLPPLARRWLGAAADNYGEVRFGGLPATPQRALALRETVQGVCDILTGAVPELAR
ncbi:DUF4129 domain-containing protein [Rhodoferax sp. U11-2br]|uniref:DUF4129 domain-containing protein n=1 Tax=Rhodoferax sp. U11-2br TaxID=2838878 RepID=UPI001BE79A14|nr:DUF4129 domain-containing protein [Rhodoferax sp. U11-2br]MBT3068039.1 DUF4129 domain-containing protein [Rhodoferax sp. U11-2br]